jgi:coenzyme F420-reducing hydrogenase gamma subunit
VIQRDRICLGPVVRAGCGALCPNFGVGCEGCRGLVPNPNLKWLKAALAEHGISQAETTARESLFLSYLMMESEAKEHGSH